MIKRFLFFIEQYNLFQKSDKILLAVSGGIDSMVLVNLFYESGFNFGVAHVNHGLRGENSDQDEDFVKHYCNQLNIPFYLLKLKKGELNKSNLQAEARLKRYQWLEDIRVENEYKFIATGHHKDDSQETFLINLTRGAGLKGLRGIAHKSDNIIRPLLFLSKVEIDDYAKKHKIYFREDASNFENIYLRNSIRNLIIPLFKEIEPRFDKGFELSLSNLDSDYQLLNELISNISHKIVKHKSNQVFIDTNQLKEYKNSSQLSYHILKDYGYSDTQVNQILACEIPSKIFFSTSHQLVIERGYLVISKINNEQNIPINIKIATLPFETENDEISFKASRIQKTEFSTINPKFQYLNFDKCNLPLIIRPWVDGDIFKPFGMNGKSKKLKKFLTDIKVGSNIKKKILVLTDSNNQILTVLGFRISNDFSVDKNSEHVLEINFRYEK